MFELFKCEMNEKWLSEKKRKLNRKGTNVGGRGARKEKEKSMNTPHKEREREREKEREREREGLYYLRQQFLSLLLMSSPLLSSTLAIHLQFLYYLSILKYMQYFS